MSLSFSLKPSSQQPFFLGVSEEFRFTWDLMIFLSLGVETLQELLDFDQFSMLFFLA